MKFIQGLSDKEEMDEKHTKDGQRVIFDYTDV